MVDVVLAFEGDRHEQHRLLRSIKNRFGSTDEIAVFEMTGKGLIGVADASSLFLEDHALSLPGSVVCAVQEGTRVILCEIQALVRPNNNSPNPIRAARGLDQKRVQMLLAVLSQKANYRTSSCDVFLNVAGGLKVDEPAVDLAVCLAIASAISNRPVKDGICVFGEVSLLGQVRQASSAARRRREAERLGLESLDVSGSIADVLAGALGVKAPEPEDEDES